MGKIREKQKIACGATDVGTSRFDLRDQTVIRWKCWDNAGEPPNVRRLHCSFAEGINKARIEIIVIGPHRRYRKKREKRKEKLSLVGSSALDCSVRRVMSAGGLFGAPNELRIAVMNRVRNLQILLLFAHHMGVCRMSSAGGMTGRGRIRACPSGTSMANLQPQPDRLPLFSRGSSRTDHLKNARRERTCVICKMCRMYGQAGVPACGGTANTPTTAARSRVLRLVGDLRKGM